MQYIIDVLDFYWGFSVDIENSIVNKVWYVEL